MKVKKWKKPVVAIGVSSIIAIPLATLACGEPAPKAITQADVDFEQKVVNELLGTKKIVVTSLFGLATNLPFDKSVAESFGIAGFEPKPSYSYTLSHPSLVVDGILNVLIQVKANNLVGANSRAHAIAVSGLDIAKAKLDLSNNKRTSKSKDDFLVIVVPKQTLTIEVANSLGIVLPSFGSKVVVEVAKDINSDEVRFVVGKEDQPKAEFAVTFDQFSTTTIISQQEVDTEQTIVNNLSGTKIKTAMAMLPSTINASFSAQTATDFGLNNFAPKPGYAYTYSHPEVKEDGNLALTISVRSGNFTGSNPNPHTVRVFGIDGNNLKSEIQKIHFTTKSESDFKSAVLSSEVSPSAINLALGITLPIIKPSLTLAVSKVASSASVSFSISKALAPALDFAVTFDLFSFTPTQVDVDSEQTRVNNLISIEPIRTSTPLKPETDILLNRVYDTNGNVVGLDHFDLKVRPPDATPDLAPTPFIPLPGYVYTYSHGQMNEDGYMPVTIKVRAKNLTGSNPTPINVPVTGLLIVRLTQVVSNITETRNFSEHVFKYYYGDFTLNDAASTFGFIAPSVAFLPSNVSLRVIKKTGVSALVYKMRMGSIDLGEVKVNFDRFISQAELDEEQAKINALEGNKTWAVDLDDLNLPTSGIFSQVLATKINLTGFVLNPRFVYKYSYQALAHDGDLDFTITVSTGDLNSTNAASHKIVTSGIDLIMAKQTLSAITLSSISDFENIPSFSNETLNAATIAKLGIVAPSIAANLVVTVSKTVGSKDVVYKISKGSASLPDLVVAFDVQTSQASVDREQALINSLNGSKTFMVSTETSIASATNLPFSIEVARKFGLHNFNPKIGYSYTYSHGALDADGILNLEIKVTAGTFVGLASAIAINVSNLSLNKATEVLKNTTTSVISRQAFANLNYDLDIDPNDPGANVLNGQALTSEVQRALGINLTFPNGVFVKITKFKVDPLVADSKLIVTYIVIKDLYENMFDVEFTNFA